MAKLKKKKCCSIHFSVFCLPFFRFPYSQTLLFALFFLSILLSADSTVDECCGWHPCGARHKVRRGHSEGTDGLTWKYVLHCSMHSVVDGNLLHHTSVLSLILYYNTSVRTRYYYSTVFCSVEYSTLYSSGLY